VLPLRQADVAVLVSILGSDGAEIERRLVAATACSPIVARRCRHLLVASIAALSIGLTGTAGAGALTYSPVPSATGARQEVSAGAALAVAALPPSADLDLHGALATGALAAPQPEVPPVAAAGSTIATSPAGTEAIISVPSLGIELPIISGGQSVIDQGVVAHYTAPGWEPPVAAGAPGTYWLAAHHATHGAPFEALPDVAVGAEIRVATSSQTFVYTVTSKEVVGLLPGDEAVYGTNPGAPLVLLQTCLDNTRRVLVHGTLTATR
jgi:LPXTG-site transpeptidase (sortase) family protein